ncbi:hypothetical protein ABH942_002847 [Flavobacterium sp. 28YEA47A]|uniref:hypothetical protein n=1 Tax=Flavobacterium sp. 28YEA47A TaxID=3156276 RepID=UPI003518C504
MTHRIIIKQQENIGKSILHVLKTLYTDGSEIKSLDDIEKFMNKYHQDAIIKISLKDNCIDSVRFICESNDIKYLIE